jgi:hypothetical protein
LLSVVSQYLSWPPGSACSSLVWLAVSGACEANDASRLLWLGTDDADASPRPLREDAKDGVAECRRFDSRALMREAISEAIEFVGPVAKRPLTKESWIESSSSMSARTVGQKVNGDGGKLASRSVQLLNRQPHDASCTKMKAVC